MGIVEHRPSPCSITKADLANVRDGWFADADRAEFVRSTTPLGSTVALSEEILHALQDAAPAELRRVGDRRWIGETAGGIRRIVEFEALKGAQYSARWGFSVDFVPRLQGKRLVWKRTSATAVFDLCIDPIDVEGRVPDWCSFTSYSPLGEVRKIARAVRQHASMDFARVNTLNDLRNLFRQRATMRFRRFGPENYVQTDLAWGLVQVATGDAEGGANRISAFCEQFGVDPMASVLVKAQQEALRQHVVPKVGY